VIPTALQSIGPSRYGAALLAVALIGSLVAPTVALAVGPSTTVTQAVGQADPTGTSPINFTVAFSDPVEGFTGGDLLFGGDAGGTWSATVTGGPKIYNVAVSGMTTAGTVIASVPSGVAYNPADEPNRASTDNATDNYVTWAPGGPTVTIDAAASSYTTSPIVFVVKFSAAVIGFAGSDVTISGTAGGTKTATVTGGPATYNVAVTGMTTSGIVTAKVPESVAVDASARPNLASTSTFGDVFWSTEGPSVTINQAAGQADPSGTSPINFTVVFSTPVTGFATGDVTISGTAGGTKTATVTGTATTYNVAVTGMTTAGSVIGYVPGDVAFDLFKELSHPSTSTDNTVTWAPAATTPLTLTTSAPIPPGAKDPVILWGQGFTLGVEFGMTGANKAVQLQGTRDGTAWSTITTLTTDAAGHAALVYRPVTNLFYRAVFAGTPDLAAATSNQVRTVVRQLAVMRPSKPGSVTAISRNGSVTFSTTVRPSRPELAPPTVTFSFYRQVAGAWQLQTSRAVPVDSAGVARTTFQFTTTGQWYVTSQAGPTPYNANSIPTPAERYNVS